MSRPRILLVPQVTELEWRIKPLLDEWAEVASYDAPGVGSEPPMDLPMSRAVTERGLVELDRRGWEGAVIVADEFGVVAASHLAAARPEAVEALALGHPRLSNSTAGERPPLNGGVLAALSQLARQDQRTYVHQFFKLTQGEEGRGGYTDDLVDGYLERVPRDILLPFLETRQEAGTTIEGNLCGLDVPMLLVKHSGCLLFTDEGYEDAVAAFPDARAESLEGKPSTSPEFAQLLRSFCEQHAGGG